MTKPARLFLTLVACLFAVASIKSCIDSSDAYNEAGWGMNSETEKLRGSMNEAERFSERIRRGGQ